MDQEHIPKAVAAIIAAGALAYGAKKMYDKHKKNKALKSFGVDVNHKKGDIKDNHSKHDHLKDDYDTYRDIADMYGSRDYK